MLWLYCEDLVYICIVGVPMYDPRRTDALVMPRPPLDHVLHTPQLVDVVLDPYVGRHLRSVFVVIVNLTLIAFKSDLLFLSFTYHRGRGKCQEFSEKVDSRIFAILFILSFVSTVRPDQIFRLKFKLKFEIIQYSV
jgi:hypothetical protein